MPEVKKGDKIKVEYEGKLEDGTIFDSSEKQGQPLEFEVGAGQIIPGFDAAVVGMQPGEEKNITLQPADAYGEYNPELVKEIGKDAFPDDQEVEAGMVFLMSLQDGRQVPVRIAQVDGDTVTIDLNPLLAGQTLNFHIKLLEINQ